MNTFVRPAIILCLSIITLSACSDEDKDSGIPLSEVPSNVIATAQDALPGIVLDEAEKHIKEDEVIYELEGKLISGEEYEIKITETGTIIKIEQED